MPTDAAHKVTGHSPTVCPACGRLRQPPLGPAPACSVDGCDNRSSVYARDGRPLCGKHGYVEWVGSSR